MDENIILILLGIIMIGFIIIRYYNFNKKIDIRLKQSNNDYKEILILEQKINTK